MPNTPIEKMTGPEMFAEAESHLTEIAEGGAEYTSVTGKAVDNRLLYATIATAHATQAQTAALVMFAGLYATAHNIRSQGLEAWKGAIPDSPLAPEPTPPQPVKQEPPGLRLYVQNQHGKQGYVLHVAREDVRIVVMVKWFTPGSQPVWIDMDMLRIIPEEEVVRCPNGQTGDECGSGENQCELCL
jgi:hypothetical protein